VPDRITSRHGRFLVQIWCICIWHAALGDCLSEIPFWRAVECASGDTISGVQESSAAADSTRHTWTICKTYHWLLAPSENRKTWHGRGGSTVEENDCWHLANSGANKAFTRMCHVTTTWRQPLSHNKKPIKEQMRWAHVFLSCLGGSFSWSLRRTGCVYDRIADPAPKKIPGTCACEWVWACACAPFFYNWADLFTWQLKLMQLHWNSVAEISCFTL